MFYQDKLFGRDFIRSQNAASTLGVCAVLTTFASYSWTMDSSYESVFIFLGNT